MWEFFEVVLAPALAGAGAGGAAGGSSGEGGLSAGAARVAEELVDVLHAVLARCLRLGLTQDLLTHSADKARVLDRIQVRGGSGGGGGSSVSPSHHPPSFLPVPLCLAHPPSPSTFF